VLSSNVLEDASDSGLSRIVAVCTGVRGLRHYGLSQKYLNRGLLFGHDKLCYTALLEHRHTEIPRHQQARAATADWHVHKNVLKNDSVAKKTFSRKVSSQ
jgi:hypothetical protein